MPEEHLSTWELFLEELKRNINPQPYDITESFKFLVQNELCEQNTYVNLVQVRIMAAYEAAISEYLHPPIALKQGNLKAETLHLGTIYEGLLSILISALFKRNKITAAQIKKISKNYPNKITFNQQIRIASELTDLHKSLISLTDSIRKERNKIHLDAISPTGSHELAHEEFRVIEIRQKLDFFLSEIKRILSI